MLGHHHHHHDEHEAGHEAGHEPHAAAAASRAGIAWRRAGRFALAGLLVLIAFAAACLTVVEPGEVVVITAFGRPMRVCTQPGLVLRWPAPIEAAVPVDVRLRSTSTGLHDVGTRDGLRILVQAYVEWRVPAEAGPVIQYLRAVRLPDAAAEQLRSYVGSSLEIAAAGFDLAQLVNTDPSKVQLDAFERALKARLAAQVLATYGISVLQVGIERLTLPGDALQATVARMTAERNTVAARRTAEGDRAAAEIRSNANRDARIRVADARTEAAQLEAQSRLQAADIYGRAYAADPSLYALLRSLDTLDGIVGDNTRLILRTDAAPFRAFVDGPAASPQPAPAPAPPASGPRR